MPRDPRPEPNGQSFWFGADLDPDGSQVWFRTRPVPRRPSSARLRPAHRFAEASLSPKPPEAGLFAGGGEILTFSPPRVTVLRLQDARTFWPCSRRLALITASGRRRCCSTCGTRSAPANVWLARSRRYGDIRKGAAVGSRRLRPVRTTGSPSAGSLWTRGLRRLAAAARAGAVAGGRKPPCRTGPLTWSPTSTGGCPRRGRANSWPTSRVRPTRGSRAVRPREPGPASNSRWARIRIY